MQAVRGGPEREVLPFAQREVHGQGPVQLQAQVLLLPVPHTLHLSGRRYVRQRCYREAGGTLRNHRQRQTRDHRDNQQSRGFAHRRGPYESGLRHPHREIRIARILPEARGRIPGREHRGDQRTGEAQDRQEGRGVRHRHGHMAIQVGGLRGGDKTHAGTLWDR